MVYGGPDGEIGASLRYLSQRYSMPYPELKAILTDIGTEELAHLEMVGTIVHQLTRNLTDKQIQEGGFGAYFVNHTNGVYPCDASGMPFTAAALQVKGDPITDIHEDLAAEQKARSTYDNILRMTDDPDVRDAIKFLRAREVVHYQRFGEGLRIVTDRLDDKNFYAFNPAFDRPAARSASAAAPSALVSAAIPEKAVSASPVPLARV
jgi:spore coat protein JC